MEVKAISNSQPSFNGYLGRNIQAYVYNTVEREVQFVLNDANARIKKVDENKIKEIKFLGLGILEKLSKYVEGMNRKTFFDLNDVDSSYIRLKFQNPIVANDGVKVYGSIVHEKPTLSNDMVAIPFDNSLSKMCQASKKDLIKLNEMTDHILKIDPKVIDNVFYKKASYELKSLGQNATGFWSKFKVRRLAKALDKFAKGLGIDTSAQVRAEEYIKLAKEKEISYKNFQKEKKECSKINQKIADDILKG